MDNSGGATGKVVKDGGGGSSSITVPFEDKECMVPVVGLELFEGVVIIFPKQLVELG